ncbi:MAG: MATE family efflux transporter [Bacteroidaceae bacterium]|nr:MATE family efflux transporter [Bacteroidaceae bacterium]
MLSRKYDSFSEQTILHIALPAIVSNITVPLLGIIDTAIVGHLGSPTYIGAIALGSMVFSLMYWLFGFLRAGTSGFTSQALGAENHEEVTYSLYRSLIFAVGVGVLLLLLGHPLSRLAFRLADASSEVEASALTYFHILIWGAPTVLPLYGLNGWFIGHGDTRSTMRIAIAQNLLNVIASLGFVLVAKMQVAGVAAGTLLAQYAGLLMAIVTWRTRYAHYRHAFHFSRLVQKEKLRRFFSVNRDIFLRTLCILSVTTFFTIAGSRQDDLTLAANSLLMQLFLFFSYFVDGFANAGESLAGRLTGAGQPTELRRMLSALFRMGAAIAAAFTLCYAVLGSTLLSLLTHHGDVQARALQFLPWTMAVPLLGFAAFLWDGVFIGLTATRKLLLTMLTATVGFFACYYLTFPMLMNHGLWLSFCLFLLLRSAVATLLSRRG